MRKIIVKAIEALVSFCQAKADVRLWPKGPTGGDYLNGLVRAKTDGTHRGSFVEGLDDLDKTLNFLRGLDFQLVEVGPEIQYKQCQYYQALLPAGYHAYTGILTLGECREQGLAVYLHHGEHGDELRLVDRVKSLPETDVISLIIEGEMMSTWYPGSFTARSPEVIDPDPPTWSVHWAVKVRLANDEG